MIVLRKIFLSFVDRYRTWVLFLMEEGAFSFGLNGVGGEEDAWQIVACPPHAVFHRAVPTDSQSFHFILFRLTEEKALALLPSPPGCRRSALPTHWWWIKVKYYTCPVCGYDKLDEELYITGVGV